VIDPRQFIGLRLRGGFVIKEIEFTQEPMADALGREAVAQTRILEAAAVGCRNPPESMMDFNEAAFERAARQAQARWGDASPTNLNLLLQFHEFREQ